MSSSISSRIESMPAMSASEVSTFDVFTFFARGVPKSSVGSPMDRRIIVTCGPPDGRDRPPPRVSGAPHLQ
eukprot:5030469-Pyramimonas_sp.AAC.1